MVFPYSKTLCSNKRQDLLPLKRAIIHLKFSCASFIPYFVGIVQFVASSYRIKKNKMMIKSIPTGCFLFDGLFSFLYIRSLKIVPQSHNNCNFLKNCWQAVEHFSSFHPIRTLNDVQVLTVRRRRPINLL